MEQDPKSPLRELLSEPENIIIVIGQKYLRSIAYFSLGLPIKQKRYYIEQSVKNVLKKYPSEETRPPKPSERLFSLN